MINYVNRTHVAAWYSLRLYIQGPDPGVEYYTDDWSLQEIPENTNWRQDALARIEKTRKSNFTLRSFFCFNNAFFVSRFDVYKTCRMYYN